MISLPEYLDALGRSHGGTIPLDGDQQHVVEHPFDVPLWVIAGPGTGKTHTLVWLVLKRLLVDGVPPHRIVLTTFTRKAAAEFQSRLLRAQAVLAAAGLEEAEVLDLTRLHLGTIHALASRVLQDERYEPTLRIRTLGDQRTQEFFLRRTRNPLLDIDDVAFWDRFQLARYRSGQPWTPNAAGRAEGACTLFNRITENAIDLAAMRATGDPHLTALADAYDQYRNDLEAHHRTDQAHLQRHLLDFLASPHGQQWLGDGYTVLVDEYQDTNPIQEDVYFALAGPRADLTVVGDDDQSLYRFRGAAVESLIDFDRACVAHTGLTPRAVYLRHNRRSHPEIVEWVNRFVGHHPALYEPDPDIRVRAPGKPPLVAASSIAGPYGPIRVISESTDAASAAKVAELIGDLVDGGFLEDYSQVALLTFSTKESSWAIGEYTDALDLEGIPYHNPRSKAAQDDEVLLAFVGGLSYILDQHLRFEGIWTLSDDTTFRLPQRLRRYVRRARNAFDDVLDASDSTGHPLHPELEAYADGAAAALAATPPDVEYLRSPGSTRLTVSELAFKLLAYEPFASSLTDALRGERLKAFNQVLAEFESLYRDGQFRLEPGPRGTQVAQWDLYPIYAVLLEGIHDGLDDPEDEETVIATGAVNVMTVHQSKGLQFEVVIVLKPQNTPFLGAAHVLEDELGPFVRRPVPRGPRRDLAARVREDTARLFFVAHSRAKRMLVLAGTNVAEWADAVGAAPSGTPLTTEAHLEAAGAQLL